MTNFPSTMVTPGTLEMACAALLSVDLDICSAEMALTTCFAALISDIIAASVFFLRTVFTTTSSNLTLPLPIDLLTVTVSFATTVTCTSTVSYPKKEITTILLPASTFSVNCPSASVVVPIVVPLIITFANAKGSFFISLSEMVPETVPFCEKEHILKSKATIKSLKFI